MALRIKGLVRTLKQVRATLKLGLSPEELPRFRHEILSVLGQVERLCLEHRTSPAALPAPSRNAYLYLKQLDLEQLPLREGPRPKTAKQVKIQNVVKIGTQLSERMWRQLDALLSSQTTRRNLLYILDKHASDIERICKKHNATPASLSLPTRQTYSWLRLLTQPTQLNHHLHALQHARTIADEYPLLDGRTTQIQIINMSALWRLRHYKDKALLKCNQGFVQADTETWRALLGSALSKRTRSRQRTVDTFTETDAFSAILSALDTIAPNRHNTSGRHHDLEDSFSRVNSSFFDKGMQRPQLHWSQTLTARKFGHYQPSDDTLMISLSLDDPDVPTFVIDFVMYHELLHKKHGFTIINNRRIAHTPAFRQEEKQFPQYDEAEAFLTKLSQKYH